MKTIKRTVFVIAIMLGLSFGIQAQDMVKKLSLDQVIFLAKDNSISAILAKNRFISSYWSYRSYKAGYLPRVSLNADLVDLNRSIIKSNVYEEGEWVEKFGEYKNLNSSLRLQIMQSVPLTGGQVYISSSLARLDPLSGEVVSFNSSPFRIGFNQPLFSVNDYKWERKTEPLKYEAAKKQYLESMENVNLEAVNLFFDLAAAQVSMKSSKDNLEKRENMYNISLGRYELGQITLDDKMDLQIQLLDAEDKLVMDSLHLDQARSKLISFLGFPSGTNIEVQVEKEVPVFVVDLPKALDYAIENNSVSLDREASLLDAQRNLAEAKANARFNANLDASFGLTQKSEDFWAAYSNPLDQQGLSVSINIPILDWGRGRGQVKMREASLELQKRLNQQQRISFEQNITNDIINFNRQGNQLKKAALKDTIAETRANITQEKFLMGQIDILKLNDAFSSRDAAKSNYINTLKTFWSGYFQIRQYTHYDFLKNRPIEYDYQEVMK